MSRGTRGTLGAGEDKAHPHPQGKRGKKQERKGNLNPFYRMLWSFGHWIIVIVLRKTIQKYRSPIFSNETVKKFYIF